MATVAFDTQKYLETLTQAGVPERQAKAMLEAERVVQGSSDVATQADLREIDRSLKSDIADVRTEIRELRTELKADQRELELRIDARFERVDGKMTLVMWMLGFLLAGIASLIVHTFFAHT